MCVYVRVCVRVRVRVRVGCALRAGYLVSVAGDSVPCTVVVDALVYLCGRASWAGLLGVSCTRPNPRFVPQTYLDAASRAALL